METILKADEIVSLMNKYERVEAYALKLLSQKLPLHFKYHNIRHTKDVVNSSVKIALVEGINPWSRGFWIMKTAAALQNIGFLYNDQMHEEIGANIAESLLSTSVYDYDLDDIIDVKNAILATKLPQSPKNILEKVVCDAEVANFGRSDFFRLSELLREESELMTGEKKSDKEWYSGVLKLLENHHYHTEAARLLFDYKKGENIKELRKKVA